MTRVLTPAITTKRASAPLSASGGSGPSAAGAITDIVQRMLYVSPVKTTRWRWRLANYSAYLEGTSAGAGVINLTAANIGFDPDLTTGRWAGSFKTTPASLSGFSGLIPNTASDLITPWVTDPALQLPKGKPVGFSMGALGDSNTRLNYSSSGVAGWGWYANGAGKNALSSALAMPVGYSNVLTLFDWRIEYEFDSVGTNGTSVVLFMGDSITEGIINNSPATQALQHETWPGAAAIRNGFAAVNMGVHSACANNSLPQLTFDPVVAAGLWKYKRFDLTTTIPDKAVIKLGTNDFGVTLSAYQAGMTNIINYLRDTIGIKEIYLCTIIPRNTAGTAETNRLAINTWIRTLPLGVHGIIDMDKALALQASSGPVTADSDFLGDYPHPTFAGYQKMSSLITFR